MITNSAPSSGDTDKIIVTDLEDAILVYTLNVTNVTKFDAGFIDTMIIMLAHKMSFTLQKSRALTQEIKLEANETYLRATGADGGEGRRLRPQRDEWVADITGQSVY